LDLPNTIPECHVLITHLLSIVAHQNNQIEGLTSRVAVLEAQKNQNSQNSSRPPSSDYPKSRPGIPKEPKGQGGQKGHKGNTLHKVDNPDEIITLHTPQCLCGALLDPSAGEIYQTYQVFDIPKPKLYVTEYQRLRQKCACGQIHLGILPPDIHAPVQYGEGVRSLTVLLSTSCQLSYEKISTLFNDLYDHDLNESTALSNNDLAYTQLESVENQIKNAILESEVVHFDESGMKIETKLGWLHTACTALFTYLFVSPHRGQQAHQDHTSILFAFKKWAVHDCYATYFKFKDCRHALCNPHLLRELQAQIEQGKPWAVQIHAFLLELYRKSEKGTKTVPHIELEKAKWQQLCQQAINIEELLLQKLQPPDMDIAKKRGRKKRGKALGLLDRLLEHSDAVLAFAEYEVVPFSNNQAERDIRPVKTKQKVAGCFRTMDGAKRYARIQGFISTCRKHKLNVFNELRAVCSTHILYHAPVGC
jgi:transposase